MNRTRFFLPIFLLVASSIFPALSVEIDAPAQQPVLSARVAAYYRKYNAPDFVREHRTPVLERHQRETKLPPSIIARKLTDDPWIKRGYLNLKLYAKGDGVTDDTQGIMDALYDAYFFQLAV